MAAKTPEKPNKKAAYGAEAISVLEGLEPVRKRPGMYIGSTGPDGLHHLIQEIFDNSRDEAMGGFCNRIEVTLLPGNRVRVVDNGRGIPVDIHPKTKLSALEMVMTTLHAGGKFGGDESAYKVSGGLHGVGASVVNALSIYTRVDVHRDGGQHMQEYSQGHKKANVKKIATSSSRGTIVLFEPDIEIFKEISFDWNRIVHHMRQQAYLVKGLTIHCIDAREVTTKIDTEKAYYLYDTALEVPTETFFFEGGLKSLVRHYNITSKPIHKNIFYFEKQIDNVTVEVALQYIDEISTKLVAYANNIPNPEGGTHVTGFKTALTRLVNTYARKNNIIKEKDENLNGDDVLEGLTAVVSVKLPEIQFEGQTKGKLGSMEAQGAVATAFGDAFSEFLEENPDDAKAIISKGLLALRARKAAKAAKDSVLRKGALEGMTLPGKLADCESKSAELSELFIVEGDSAGGSAKQGRDRKIQAILPLKGKILNVERARLDKMLASNEVRALVLALGTAIGDTFDIQKLRYHKIIIATDADVDGSHIRTLLLTLFFRYFKPLIESGHIHIAQPPLYKIKHGKENYYAYSDAERDATLKRLGYNAEDIEIGEEGDDTDEEAEVKTKSASRKPNVQRYKGLGEMNPEELWETTMDPRTRVTKQIRIDDALDAEKAFEVLMGDDVPSRKSFIQTHAKQANLDI
ncbi:MAG: topoisomerase (ATP-hydrolyzing) subunit [Candidatus Parcubacteria bacterium]|jgi:DNA gyrase subunit B